MATATNADRLTETFYRALHSHVQQHVTNIQDIIEASENIRHAFTEELILHSPELAKCKVPNWMPQK